MSKNKKIEVKGTEIAIFQGVTSDYISLTDMARYRDTDRTNYVIQNWMRTRSAIEFCGLWEQMYNLDFKSIEFDAFKNESGSNSFLSLAHAQRHCSRIGRFQPPLESK